MVKFSWTLELSDSERKFFTVIIVRIISYAERLWAGTDILYNQNGHYIIIKGSFRANKRRKIQILGCVISFNSSRACLKKASTARLIILKLYRKLILSFLEN